MSALLNLEMYKYPRTHHIADSRLQPGDEDLYNFPFSTLAGKYVVIEEKMDGANAAVSFSEDGRLLLQSRGHYLTGSGREIHFTLFKQWANLHASVLWEVLGSRYVMYGEWLYAKHTIFYDALPHYFMEFDLFDKERGSFLDTAQRHHLLAGSPVVSVKVLLAGDADAHLRQQKALTTLVADSYFITPNQLGTLRTVCQQRGLDGQRAIQETDASRTMEGLYIKVEQAGCVTERYKYVRLSFLTSVIQSESHWLARPIIPNQLAEGVDIFVG